MRRFLRLHPFISTVSALFSALLIFYLALIATFPVYHYSIANSLNGVGRYAYFTPQGLLHVAVTSSGYHYSLDNDDDDIAELPLIISDMGIEVPVTADFWTLHYQADYGFRNDSRVLNPLVIINIVLRK